MVFSTDNLYKKENIINNAPAEQKAVIKVSESTSLFANALKYLLDENILIENELAKYNQITFTNKKLLSLNEENILSRVLRGNQPQPAYNATNTSGIFQRVRTGLTIEGIVEFIIRGFIRIIVQIWREFEIICMNLVSKSSQIKRFTPKINMLDRPIPYNDYAFTYTHIIDSTNRTNLNADLTNIYNEIMGFINSFSGIKNARDVENAINQFNSDKAHDEPNYDELRGKLLGSNSLIPAEKFNEALFKYFRNNTSIAPFVRDFSPENIRYRLEAWNRMPKVIRKYEADKRDLESDGEKFVSKINRANVDKYLKDVPVNVVELYSNLVNRYSSRIKETCSIYVMYYAQRLSAARMELADNTKILINTCKFIVREGL